MDAEVIVIIVSVAFKVLLMALLLYVARLAQWHIINRACKAKNRTIRQLARRMRRHKDNQPSISSRGSV